MNLVEESFKELFPEKEFPYEHSLRYSGKFKPYNANVRIRGRNLTFNLSRKWKKVSRDIKKGLIQELLLKVTKSKGRKTTSMDLYNIFIKKAELAAPKTKIDSFLEFSFNRVNEKYFNGMIDKPNLVWHNSSRRLGTYEYGSDTISMTKGLKGAEQEVLDYVMYHEMLHKKYKFKSKNGRNYHHTKEFKEKEKEFENQEQIEKRLNRLRLPKKKRKIRSRLRNLFLFP